MKKVVQLMSTFSTKALPDRPGFALTFLEHLLTVKLADDTTIPQYSDAVKDLERICSLEMQKLAMKFPDDFMVSLAISVMSKMLKSIRMCMIAWNVRSMRLLPLQTLTIDNEWHLMLSFSSLCKRLLYITSTKTDAFTVIALQHWIVRPRRLV